MKRAASIILYNDDGKYLLQLRDNIKIPFPNFWTFFGGHCENGESEGETIRREIKEEIGYELKEIKLFKEDKWKDEIFSVFIGKIDIPISKIKLKEGQDARFFSKEEVLEMDLAFNYNKIFKEFLNNKLFKAI